jgi:hypothetical protein
VERPLRPPSQARCIPSGSGICGRRSGAWGVGVSSSQVPSVGSCATSAEQPHRARGRDSPRASRYPDRHGGRGCEPREGEWATGTRFRSLPRCRRRAGRSRYPDINGRDSSYLKIRRHRVVRLLKHRQPRSIDLSRRRSGLTRISSVTSREGRSRLRGRPPRRRAGS